MMEARQLLVTRFNAQKAAVESSTRRLPAESSIGKAAAWGKDTTRKPREKVAVGENRSENPNEEAEGSTTKKICNHPSYSQMITAAIRSLDESKGSSRQAILKYILSTFAVNEKMVKINLNVALKRDVLSGDLVQVTGKGASGSFRLKRSKTEPEGSKAGPKCSKVKHESSKTKPESSKDKPRHLKKSGKSRGLNSSTRERTSCTYVH
nr:histone H1-delta-like [Cherax quadricarinatus]